MRAYLAQYLAFKKKKRKGKRFRISQIVGEAVLPCLQGNVAVEQPVVLRTARILGTGRALWGHRAVGGGRAGVTARRVVVPVQGVDGGGMVLQTG